jgi:hypothetical protein
MKLSGQKMSVAAAGVSLCVCHGSSGIGSHTYRWSQVHLVLTALFRGAMIHPRPLAVFVLFVAIWIFPPDLIFGTRQWMLRARIEFCKVMSTAGPANLFDIMYCFSYHIVALTLRYVSLLTWISGY